MTKELNIEIELGDLFSGGNQFKELREIVKSSTVFSTDELYDALENGSVFHLAKKKDTGKIIGYGISKLYYPWEILKVDEECLKKCEDEITEEDLEDRIGYISAVEVIPQYQGQGVGKRLAEKIMEAYSAYNMALLSTLEATAFWMSMGFRNIIGWSGVFPYLFYRDKQKRFVSIQTSLFFLENC